MFGILTSLVMLAGTACGAADGTSAEADTSVQEDTLSAKTFTADSSNVKLLGRNYLADDGTLWVVHSASAWSSASREQRLPLPLWETAVRALLRTAEMKPALQFM